MRLRKHEPVNRLKLLAALGLSLYLSGGLEVLARRPLFQLPANQKLENGSGPAATPEPLPSTPNQSLQPIKLTDDSPSNGTAATDTGGVGLLKSTVTATSFIPKSPINQETTTAIPVSGISDKLNDRLLKNAKDVNAMPLPLLPTPEECEKKADTILDAEKVQLSDLWEATLTRSPDIQFVIQKLMPTSDPGHTSAILMRMLSTAVFGAMGAVNMMSPNIGTYAVTGSGANMVASLLSSQQSKQAKAARLTQTESIMLYNMVRTTADRLVDQYRNYKKAVKTLDKAGNDLQDLQGMVTQARAGQDAARQVEMEYTVRRAQRDVDAISEDTKHYRQALVDLAGPESVAKLDKQMQDEAGQLLEATPGGSGGRQTASAPASQS